MPPPRPSPIDPLTGPKLALSGRVVTMDPAFTVLDKAVVHIDAGRIVAVRPPAAPPPTGFEGVAVVPTAGTIYPGLIDLHNHMAYNALRLWAVPRTYTNRDQWGGSPEYQRLVSAPMRVIGMTAGLLPAVVRYVECKCLVAGVTTTQGIALFSNAGARRYWRGLVRNAEETGDVDLPEAAAKIADVDAADAARFLTALRRQTCFLLHLSEGTDDAARRHFLALRLADGRWAVTDALAGIHCAALRAEDFAVLGQTGAAMVWSPLSNLLLYGKTADVRAAREAGVKVALGSDWSPTGSKNLLGELKAARLASRAAGGVFSDRDLVTMVTRNAAAILRWQAALGSLEAGKRADLVVLDGAAADPYAGLIKAKETDVKLVLIGGVPRFGSPGLMAKCGVAAGEQVRVGGRPRVLFLAQPTADPDVGPITLGAATATLTDAFHRIPELAAALERAPAPHALWPGVLGVGGGPLVWRLALDELAPTGVDLRPRLPAPGTHAPTGPTRATPAAAAPLSEALRPMTLDPLTVADDPDYLRTVAAERNLPPDFKAGLAALY
jgi:5-methylthioadenosine/S-adenosylhomocysteine deaminase